MLPYLLTGFLAGVATAIGILAMGAGVFWLWVFGDDPWPGYAEVALVAVAYSAGLAVFVTFTVRGHRRRRD